MKKYFIFAIFITFLTACAVKGPLYQPEKAQSQQEQTS